MRRALRFADSRTSFLVVALVATSACGLSAPEVATAGGDASPTAPLPYDPSAPATPPPASEDRTVIYDDVLAAGVRDMSSALVRIAHGETVRSGAQAISAEVDRRLAIHLAFPGGVDVTRYETLELWVHGGATGGQRARLAVLSKGLITAGVELGTLLPGGKVAGGEWQLVRVPVADLGFKGTHVDGVWLGDVTSGDQPTLFVDDVAFVAAGGEKPAAAADSAPRQPATDTVVVEPDADRKPINPHVYGANFGSQEQLQRQKFPARRWGGNHTSRYAWDIDVANRANDWFFMNINEANPSPGELPHGSAADDFIDETIESGADALVTVPMLGWVPKDRSETWSYSVSKYGAQQSVNGDAGNGRRPDGSRIDNDKADTSREVGPEYVTDWMKHIASRVGTASEGGVRFFALDNEWTLWPETHPDVHPHNPTYDEMWEKVVAYGGAMKSLDPDVKLFGPMAYGWCGYFGVQGECKDGPDRREHGDLIPWFLDQVCNYQRETGVRLIDFLTIHYYPQMPRVYSQDDSPETQGYRMRALKSLYDPNYVDESWVNQPVQLIPRMKSWIAEHCPDLKLAITEYSFGGEDSLSGALAQAEALAVFGREGVDFATKWIAPEDGSRIQDGFSFWRNYDGAGAMVQGDSVRATTFSIDAVPSYALRDGDQLYVVLFNKTGAARRVQVDVTGGVAGTVQLFGFDGSRRQGALGSVEGGGSGFAVELPAMSATLAVTTLAR